MGKEEKDSLPQDRQPAVSPFARACEREEIPQPMSPEVIAADSAARGKAAVALNPLGTPPPIRLKSMAPARPAWRVGPCTSSTFAS